MSTVSPGLVLTIVTTFGCVGGLLGPAFIGYLAEATTLSMAFAAVACLLAAVGASGRLIIPAPALREV